MPVLGPQNDPALVDPQIPAPLGTDLDHAVLSAGAVQRGGRGTLHDLDGLHVQGADVGQGVVGDDAVDDDEGILRAGDRGRTTEQDTCVGAGLTGIPDDLGARYLTDDEPFHRRRGHWYVCEVQLLHRERQLDAWSLPRHTGHHHLL